MAKRKGMTDEQAVALRRTGRRYVQADPQMRGLFLRVPASDQSPVAYTVILKRRGRQVWERVGTSADTTIDEARAKAHEVIRRIKAGKPRPIPPAAPQSVTATCEKWLVRHVDKRGLRSAGELRRIIKKLIVPDIGKDDFVSLRRSDITNFLDRIEDSHGAWQADATLAVLRSVASWVQSRSDDYVPPFGRNMRRTAPAARRRSRILNDEELRIVWTAAEKDGGPYGLLIRLALWTAQRKAKILDLYWTDISPDGVWTIRSEPREKGHGGRLALPAAALDAIRQMPRLANDPQIFYRQPSHYDKSRFDRVTGITGWSIHDLRRTSRSLLSRIGIAHETAENLLGHVIPGVASIYNRDSFEPQKAAALKQLADAIERIVRPSPSNVLPLRGAVAP
jgi:integrase